MAYTIASVSTPSGSGAISIVRLCGERSLDYALCFFHCKELSGSLEEVKKSITPSMMYLGRFKYKDIPASELRNLIDVTIVEGDEAISDTLTYSIETYVNSRLQNSTNEVFKTLLKELMKYSDSARNYFR